MALTLQISDQSYMTGDAPFIEGGVITDDKKGIIGSNELLFVTLRGTNESNYSLLDESKVDLYVDNFNFKFPDPIPQYQSGKIWCRGYFKDSIDAVLDSGISETDLQATLTVNSGIIPEKGYCLIDDEICYFLKVNDTTITINRAFFKTKASAHLADAIVGFSTVMQTCINDYKIEFENQEGDLFRWKNYKWRGQA